MTEPTDETPEVSEVPVGTVWIIRASAPVKITRPDGLEVTVVAEHGMAVHYLNLPGDYTAETASGKTETATVV